jgi:hypothetical protein
MDPLTVLFAEDDAETRELVNILLGEKTSK